MKQGKVFRGVQFAPHRPHVAQDGCECGPTQNQNLLKTLRFFVCVTTYHNAFNVWPKTTPLLPARPRDTKRLDTAGLENDRAAALYQVTEEGL